MESTGHSERTLSAITKAFVSALEQGDARALAQTFTDDGVLLPNGAPEVRGHAAIQAFWQHTIDAGVTRAVFSTRELFPLGDVAIEVGEFTLHHHSGALADQGKYMVMWRLTGTQWRWHRNIFNTSRS